MTERPTSPLASPWSRAFATGLDCLLVVVVPLPGSFVSIVDAGIANGVTGCLLIAFLFFQIFWVSTRGQTIGKRILGLKIVRTDGRPCGFVRGVLLRNVYSFALSVLGSVPVLVLIAVVVDLGLIFRSDRRTVHDIIAGTIVIRHRAQPAPASGD